MVTSIGSGPSPHAPRAADRNSRVDRFVRRPTYFAIHSRGLPERDVLRSKLATPYSTGGTPLELLLYFDAENWLVAGGIPPVDFSWHAQHVMQPLLTPMPSHIRRVWVFERYRNSVLWSYSG
jgi:hypothetical protein